MRLLALHLQRYSPTLFTFFLSSFLPLLCLVCEFSETIINLGICSLPNLFSPNLVSLSQVWQGKLKLFNAARVEKPEWMGSQKESRRIACLLQSLCYPFALCLLSFFHPILLLCVLAFDSGERKICVCIMNKIRCHSLWTFKTSKRL